MVISLVHNKKIIRINKNEKEITKIITYTLQYIDSARFMNSFLSNLADNVAEVKWKYGRDNEQCPACEIKCKYCECFFAYQNFKNNLLKYKCLCCNKNYQDVR